MRNRVIRTGATVVAVIAVMLLRPAQGQGATCVSDPASVAAADMAFIGNLTGVNPAGDQATLAVEEVWSAGDLPAVVVVTGSPGQWSGATATRYLVLATVVAGSLHVGVGECDIAVPWDASYAAIRPASSHPPQAASEQGGLPVPLLVIAGAAALIGAISLVAFRPSRAAP